MELKRVAPGLRGWVIGGAFFVPGVVLAEGAYTLLDVLMFGRKVELWQTLVAAAAVLIGFGLVQVANTVFTNEMRRAEPFSARHGVTEKDARRFIRWGFWFAWALPLMVRLAMLVAARLAG